MALPSHSLDPSRSVPIFACRPDVAPRFVSCDRNFLAALAQLERYARHEQAVVLIEGESGTGKSYFAQHLHRVSLRSRASYQFVLLSTLHHKLAAAHLFRHLPCADTDAR